jgi:plastocyanin
MKPLHIILFGLLFISLSLTSAACTSNSTQVDMPDENSPSNQEVTTIEIDNIGSNAYVILGIDGEGASANLNEENTELNLRIGDRFQFENVAGASNHPLNFRNSNRDKLLGQSNGDGLYDDDADVDVQFDGNNISFTLTSGLAAELNGYICSFHPGMNGDISVIE